MHAVQLTLVRRVRTGPQGLDQRDGLVEPRHPPRRGDLEHVVLLDATEADAQDRAALAQLIQRRDLLRDMNRVIRR